MLSLCGVVAFHSCGGSAGFCAVRGDVGIYQWSLGAVGVSAAAAAWRCWRFVRALCRRALLPYLVNPPNLDRLNCGS